jgi:hypothetical protein
MRIPAQLVMVCLFVSAATASEVPATVSVMVVGDFHMSNPGRDMHNMTADDMFADKRQKEIAAVTDALARFAPTVVAAEWSADVASQRFTAYLQGTLAPSRNEVVQLGFRLAKTVNLLQFHGIDVEGDFPYEAVQTYAMAHGESAILDQQSARVQALVEKTDATLKQGTVSQTLRFINDPMRIAGDNEFYRSTLAIGGGNTQPGAELMTAWYRRNFLICANLVQATKPGDRVVLFYGFGHAFLLRQCIQEMPGFKLVEPNDYLPK